MKRLAVLAAAAIAYVLAAWMVTPGFYDGFGPLQPYNWTCPPPQAGANTKPSSGHADIKVIDGKSDANSAYTQDGQIVIGFLPDSFDAAGKTSISVDVAPLNTCPQPKGVQFVTNIYKIAADAPLKKGANVTMRRGGAFSVTFTPLSSVRVTGNPRPCCPGAGCSVAPPFEQA